MFLDRAGNPIGDGDADYEEDPANPTADLPGEVISKVAPDHVKITGMDAENAEPIKFQANDSTQYIKRLRLMILTHLRHKNHL